jgi:hypothetical protein
LTLSLVIAGPHRPERKDLKVKGTSETIKRGTLVKNFRLTPTAPRP